MALVRTTRSTTSGIHYLSLLQSRRKTFRQLMAWDLKISCLSVWFSSTMYLSRVLYFLRSFQFCQFFLGLGKGQRGNFSSPRHPPRLYVIIPLVQLDFLFLVSTNPSIQSLHLDLSYNFTSNSMKYR